MGVLSNARHEKFAQCLFEGMSQRKAYREAFPNSIKWKDNTVDSRASELYKTSEVLVRLEELQNETAKKNIMSAQERLEWLTNVVKGIEELDASASDKMKAIDIMNKMQGEYVQKVEADVNSEVTINIELVDE